MEREVITILYYALVGLNAYILANLLNLADTGKIVLLAILAASIAFFMIQLVLRIGLI